MRITRTLAGIAAVLSCLFVPHQATAQTRESQGIWWQIDRKIDTGYDPDAIWGAPQYSSTGTIGNAPQVVGGQSFSISDSVKSSYGQLVGSISVDQSSLKFIFNEEISAKQAQNKNMFSLESTMRNFSAGYNVNPILYVEDGDNTKLRVTIRVVSHAEGEAKLYPGGIAPSGSLVLICATDILHPDDSKGVFRDNINVNSGKRADSWNTDDSIERTAVVPVNKYFINNIKSAEGMEVLGKHMRWPFASKEKKGFYFLTWGDIFEKFVTEDAKSSAALNVFSDSSHFIGGHIDGGEISGSIKEEVTVTVERVGPPKPAEAAIGVDFNRDGLIDYDKADKTSAAKPFDFWLNTDRDAYVPEDEDQEDTSPDLGQDCADNRISVERDLEDFTRLHIQAPAGFRPDGSWKCKVNFVNPTGSPAIRLFKAVSPGTEYLTKPETATKQVGFTSDLVVGATPIEIPASLFQSDNANKFRAALIFEGVKAGKGALQVHFYKDGKEQTAKNPVYLNLRPIQDFYDYYETKSTPTHTVDQTIGAAQTSDYILFVHGWRMKEWQKKGFAETAVKRLWQRGYKGHFGLFSWPTDYTDLIRVGNIRVPIDKGNYNRSEQKAWESASSLQELLVSLNEKFPQKVSIFAHSMGNIVVSEALLEEAETQSPQKIVNTYIATQAASVAQAYDARIEDGGDQKLHGYSGPNVYAAYPLAVPSVPYFEGTKGNGGLRASAGKLLNYFNEQDYALKNWGWGQLLNKPESGSDPDLFDYGYDPTETLDQPQAVYGFYRKARKGDSKSKTQLSFPSDRYEIFAHAAPSFSVALGRQQMPITGGLFSDNVNLGEAPFNFTNKPSDHSAQFNSTLMERYRYWDKLMQDFGIDVSPPK